MLTTGGATSPECRRLHDHIILVRTALVDVRLAIGGPTCLPSNGSRPCGPGAHSTEIARQPDAVVHQEGPGRGTHGVTGINHSTPLPQGATSDLPPPKAAEQ